MVALPVDAAMWWDVWVVSKKREARVQSLTHGYEYQAVNMHVGWLNPSLGTRHE